MPDQEARSAATKQLAVPKHVAPAHRHAYLGGAYFRRNGYEITDNPYLEPSYAEAWRRGFVEAETDA